MTPTYDLSGMGGPVSITVHELTALAASGKRKVKSGRSGWVRVTPNETIAMAWFADLFLEDERHPDPEPQPVEGETT